MTASSAGAPRGVRHLAGFLASLAAHRDRPSTLGRAALGIAEALDAPLCAIVDREEVVALVGVPAGEAATDELVAAARGTATTVTGAAGEHVPVTAVRASPEAPRAVVVGCPGGPLDDAGQELVRAMVQVLELTLESHATAERERQLRRAVEAQARELRQVNAHLSDALRVRRDLVAMASHELRTPLVAMLGFASLLRDGWEEFDDAERDEYLAIMDRHGHRMLRLVDDLLTVGRLEDDRIVTRPVELSLSDRLGAILRDLGEHGIELRPADGPDRVVADPDHLSQIVGNLLDNAQKYGAPPIRVEVTGARQWCGVDVVDAGPGVPEEFVPSLFERFTQASTGMRRAGRGVGLGLAIVAGLAGRNGGWVVYDREEGSTRFSVRFPRPGGQRDRV